MYKDAEIYAEIYEETHLGSRLRGMTVRRHARRDVPVQDLGNGACRILPTPRLDQYDGDPQD